MEKTKKVGYIVKSHGQTVGDTVYFKEIRVEHVIGNMTYYIPYTEDDLELLVSDACEYAWDNNDGWEWLPNGEVITLVINGIEHGDYPVEVDFDPTFLVGERCNMEIAK